MIVYALPDGRLMVPRRAESEGVIGDGYVAIGADDPEYQRWQDWFARTGEAPRPWPGDDSSEAAP